MRKEYNKLVRDRIPEIIGNHNHTCETVTLNPADYAQALRQKLIEEATEAATASDADLVTELADLYEVIDALLQTYNISRETAIAEQKRRREERGGFEKRIKLLWTEKQQ